MHGGCERESHRERQRQGQQGWRTGTHIVRAKASVWKGDTWAECSARHKKHMCGPFHTRCRCRCRTRRAGCTCIADCSPAQAHSITSFPANTPGRQNQRTRPASDWVAADRDRLLWAHMTSPGSEGLPRSRPLARGREKSRGCLADPRDDARHWRAPKNGAPMRPLLFSKGVPGTREAAGGQRQSTQPLGAPRGFHWPPITHWQPAQACA